MDLNLPFPRAAIRDLLQPVYHGPGHWNLRSRNVLGPRQTTRQRVPCYLCGIELEWPVKAMHEDACLTRWQHLQAHMPVGCQKAPVVPYVDLKYGESDPQVLQAYREEALRCAWVLFWVAALLTADGMIQVVIGPGGGT